MVVVSVAAIMGVGIIQSGYAAGSISDFSAQVQKVGQLTTAMRQQPDFAEAAPVPVMTTAIDSGFFVTGTVDGITQNCRIAGQLMACNPVYRNGLVPENDNSQLARELYLDQMFRTWLRTGDIRVACPSSVQHPCTGGYVYNCTHTIVPETHHISRPCTADDVTAGHCPSNCAILINSATVLFQFGHHSDEFGQGELLAAFG